MFPPVPTGSQSDARPSSWTSRTVDPFNSWNTVIMPQSRDLAAVSFLFLFILSNLLLVRADPVRSTSVSSWKPQRSRLWKTSQYFKYKIWPNLTFCSCQKTCMPTFFTPHLRTNSPGKCANIHSTSEMINKERRFFVVLSKNVISKFAWFHHRSLQSGRTSCCPPSRNLSK